MTKQTQDVFEKQNQTKDKYSEQKSFQQVIFFRQRKKKL